MNTAPAERPRRAVEHLVSATASRIRRPPTSRRIARRHAAVLIGKWVLPAGALALLAMIALWPEFDREPALAYRQPVVDFTGFYSNAAKPIDRSIGGSKGRASSA